MILYDTMETNQAQSFGSGMRALSRGLIPRGRTEEG